MRSRANSSLGRVVAGAVAGGADLPFEIASRLPFGRLGGRPECLACGCGVLLFGVPLAESTEGRRSPQLPWARWRATSGACETRFLSPWPRPDLHFQFREARGGWSGSRHFAGGVLRTARGSARLLGCPYSALF